MGVIINNKADNVVAPVFLCHSFADESTVCLLHSSIEERNVGKLLTLDLLAKGQGVPTHKHKSVLAGRDQTRCGASVEVMIIVNDLIHAKKSKQGWSIDRRCLEERGIYSLTVNSSTQLMVDLWPVRAGEVWGIYDKSN